MKRLLLIILIALLIGTGITAWIFLGPATDFNEPQKYLYIRGNAASRKAVLDSLEKDHLVTNAKAFDFLASRMNYWKAVKPGRYEIKNGSSLLSMVRMLRNGAQSPVKLVITKLRTKEDLARMAGNRFEFDSLAMIHFLNSADSLKEY